MPADGTLAARCNDREFGTSRWQLVYQATAASLWAKGANPRPPSAHLYVFPRRPLPDTGHSKAAPTAAPGRPQASPFVVGFVAQQEGPLAREGIGLTAVATGVGR